MCSVPYAQENTRSFIKSVLFAWKKYTEYLKEILGILFQLAGQYIEFLLRILMVMDLL